MSGHRLHFSMTENKNEAGLPLERREHSKERPASRDGGEGGEVIVDKMAFGAAVAPVQVLAKAVSNSPVV